MRTGVTPANTAPAWTEFEDVLTRLRKRWDSGEFLKSWTARDALTPIGVALGGPATADLSARFDDVRAWLQRWADVERRRPVTLRRRPAGHRSIGANDLPTHVDISGYHELWDLLGVGAEVERFAALRASTAAAEPGLVPWMDRTPMSVLRHGAEWERLVAAVQWLAAAAGDATTYLREIPVPGVDTKFIETRRTVLASLLDELLPPAAIDSSQPASRFEQRYGFAVKPTLVRFRSLDPDLALPGGVSEMVVRFEEFARVAPVHPAVLVVENQITYLALPAVPGTVAIWGSGFALSGFGSLPWFRDRRVLYWGDIDTHGFVALSRLRALVGHTESLLMDTATLLAHRDQWVTEDTPTRVPLAFLTPAEAAVFGELVDDVHGASVRFEQERVSFTALRGALRAAGLLHRGGAPRERRSGDSSPPAGPGAGGDADAAGDADALAAG